MTQLLTELPHDFLPQRTEPAALGASVGTVCHHFPSYRPIIFEKT